MTRKRTALGTSAKLALLAIVVMILVVYYVAVGGSVKIPPLQVLREIFSRGTDLTVTSVVWDVRLPRVCACLTVGAILGLVGSAFQALFRNPLAEPYVVGVSSGAAVGGALALVFGFGASWTGFAYGLGLM